MKASGKGMVGSPKLSPNADQIAAGSEMDEDGPKATPMKDSDMDTSNQSENPNGFGIDSLAFKKVTSGY